MLPPLNLTLLSSISRTEFLICLGMMAHETGWTAQELPSRGRLRRAIVRGDSGISLTDLYACGVIDTWSW
jgi:hypothetical protein